MITTQWSYCLFSLCSLCCQTVCFNFTSILFELGPPLQAKMTISKVWRDSIDQIKLINTKKRYVQKKI